MKKIRNYILTTELLEAYQNAALKNASELMEEAKLLLSNKHYARAYFLALSSIEETGKAHLAFDAKGRNFSNGGVCEIIKQKFENHSNKITSAFICWLNSTKLSEAEEFIKSATKLMIDLKYGREKSMYIDVKENDQSISIPSEMVRPIAAENCVSLSYNCLHYTKIYIDKNIPIKRTSYENQLICMNQKDLSQMLNTKDFWEFLLSEWKEGNADWATVTVKYHSCYHQKKKMFNVENINETQIEK